MRTNEIGAMGLSDGGAGEAFGRWLAGVPGAERAKILGMDCAEIEDAFYRDLAFGTGGLRGRLGLGPNRINAYTVGKVTQGLADYLRSKYEKPSVALCRDTRRGSEELVRRTAEVLAGNGIPTYMFDRVEPTPALSFAVRELGCSGASTSPLPTTPPPTTATRSTVPTAAKSRSMTRGRYRRPSTLSTASTMSRCYRSNAPSTRVSSSGFPRRFSTATSRRFSASPLTRIAPDCEWSTPRCMESALSACRAP